MKQSILMRVLFCKIHCPSFICFCKPPSAAHLYSPGPLKLENTPRVPSPRAPVTSQHLSAEETTEVKEESIDGNQQEIHRVLKSCIRKPSSAASNDVQNKKVQWMDSVGKQLVEIKEFESSETGDTDNEDDNRGCTCIIL